MKVTEWCSATKHTLAQVGPSQFAAGEGTVRKAVKDRMIITALGLAGLPVAICSVSWAHTAVETSLNLRPWAHMTLEGSLNVLWFLLALGALARWRAPEGSSGRSQLLGLVSLVFILLLLFPVISANDDLAQRDLINDARTSHSITAVLKNEKQLSHVAPTGLLGRPMPLAAQTPVIDPAIYELISEPAHVESVAAAGNATGNHSPPCC